MQDIQKTLTVVVGSVLTLVGLAGFFTGSSLLGFGINLLHNIVHLLTGGLGLYLGLTSGGRNSMLYNKWVGVVYLAVAALGFIPGISGLLVVLLNNNMADNVLHLLLGVVLAGVGFGVKPKAMA